jgi:thiol-disulfide isomerase/thioredoxin
MKHLVILLTFSFFLQISLTAQEDNTGINFFEGNWEELLAEAKNQNKPIFIDAYTSWCGPCKTMAKEIFPNEDVGEYYNEHFICYKSDMEKGEGIEIAKKFKVKCYPQLLFIDAEENILHRTAGSRSVEEFIALGDIAINPKENFHYYKTLFEKEEKDIENGFLYLEMKKSSCLSTTDELNKIVSHLKNNKNLQTDENHKKLFEFDIQSPSVAFNYIISNEKAMIKVTSENQFIYKIGTSSFKALQKSISGETEEQTKKILKNTTEIKDGINTFLNKIKVNENYHKALEAYYLLHLYSDDLASHTNEVYNYVQNYYYHYTFADYYFYYITQYAEIMINNSADKQQLENVKTWLQKAIEEREWAESHYQLAKLEHSFGNYSKALEEAKKAKTMLEEQEKETEEVDKLIEKINSDK